MTVVVHMVQPTASNKDICWLCYITYRVILGVPLNSMVDCIDAICDRYPEYSPWNHSHINVAAQVHGPELGMATLKSQCMTWTVDSLKTRTTKRICSLCPLNRLSRNILVWNSFSVPNVKVFFPADHVLYQVSNPATILKLIQGYPFMLSMLQDGNQQPVFELLIVISWSSPYTLLTNTSTVRALCGFWKWGKHRNIPIHDTCSNIGPSRYLTLPIFHAINRWDTTSHFLGCGKKIAWAIHQYSLPNETSCFTLRCLGMQKFERFVVIVYSKGCQWSQALSFFLKS